MDCVLERNVAREVRGPRPPKKLVSFLPIDEAMALMDAKTHDGRARVRDAAVLELLYATGLRVSELSGLDLDDLDRSQQTVRVPVGQDGKLQLAAQLFRPSGNAVAPAVAIFHGCGGPGQNTARMAPWKVKAVFMRSRIGGMTIAPNTTPRTSATC